MSTSDRTPPKVGYSLVPVNDGVQRVIRSDGLHVGNLKRVGAVWKFKAVGYEAAGAVTPGGGPLTDRHNTMFNESDASAVNLKFASVTR